MAVDRRGGRRSRTTRREAGRRSPGATTRSAARPAGIVKTGVHPSAAPARGRDRAPRPRDTSWDLPGAARRAAAALSARRRERASGARAQRSSRARRRSRRSTSTTRPARSRASSPAPCSEARAAALVAARVACRSAAASSCSSLVAGILLGPLPVWRHVPFGSKLATRDHIVSAHDRAAARVLAAVPAGARGQRHQHARRASLRAPAHLQLPRAPRGALGRGRPDAAELPRRRDRQDGSPPRTRGCGATRAGRSSGPRTASSSSTSAAG